ncbi:spore coat protein [Mesobacillus foraminis]|uniref:Coat F domain-containing protein n=1 Tax=Mesobacillus foraminis TaxID=279826 RepID=A0A4R2BG39_9BACI|nr:spore coat protein [Mesobacillus foraminis]TCN25997.1 coat F domain-containing protein [Mesobacillus foraminis]
MQNQQSQNTSKIANPQTGELPKVKSPEMNDRDFLNDGLSTCKYLTDSLNIAVREASHEQLYNDMVQILKETHDSCREMYNMMFQHGWYKLEAEEQQKIDQAHKQFSNYSSQFPYQ